LGVRASHTNTGFKKYLVKSLGIKSLSDKEQRETAFDEFVAHWSVRDKRFKFYQAIGPAVGFMLTVTSLIQALHPALRVAGDLDGFLNGIHIAMASTFVGLLLRFIALTAARFNDGILTRADKVLNGEGP
jgi:biopolymer transport protein ExbB/TolQ